MTILRGRLHGLWASLTDPRMEQGLLDDTVVPSTFLAANNIFLSGNFPFPNTAAENLNKSPPLLFLFRPANIIDQHPIAYRDKSFKLAAAARAPEDSSPATRMQNIFARRPVFFDRGASLSHYLEDWAIDGYPRCLPPGFPNLGSLCGIHAVASPHAMNADTRGLQGPDEYPFKPSWETRIFEYDQQIGSGTRYPHLILLSVQSCNGVAGTISLGELTLIVTAMRCRAFQPAEFDPEAIMVGDAEQSEDGNPEPAREDELEFNDEKRFPVIIVSLVGPQHVRVIYACMDGLKLSIRISALRKIQPTDETIVRDMASVLLSWPLMERP